MDRLLETLRELDALRDQPERDNPDIVIRRTLEAIPPVFADDGFIQTLPSALRKGLKSLGIQRLYAHQVEAIEAIRSGADVVLEAPTAAGKTLCFTIPLMERLLDDPSGHALMIHPMKALSNDQRRQFQELAAATSASAGRRIESWNYDGDTDQEHRSLLRSCPPAVLLTNPEMLHQSFLAWNDRWRHFLSNLRMVIIDEIHEYRGYFGTNFALLLRRFLALLNRLGVKPQLVLATATCGNAEEHARRLTGRPCTLVRARTSMRPERHFAFIEPGIPDYRFHEIYSLRIARAALACMRHELTTIVFCPSRRFAEQVAIRTRREAADFGISPELIAPYRSGYSPSQRREIEDGLRDGRLRVVFTTNALEIGIDIGRLDACILAGFPDNVLSAWQRIGRTGRSWDKKAYVLFYAFNNPFDRFYARNLPTFLSKPLDEILIGVANEELMLRHLPYLFYECGGEIPDELEGVLGREFFNLARKTMEEGRPETRHRPNYKRLDIRGSSGKILRLVYKEREIGTISAVHQFREAYIGAVYNHCGRAYRVVGLTADEVLLEDADPNLKSEGLFYNVMQQAEILQGHRYHDGLTAATGRLVVFENFAGFRLVDTRTGEVVEEEGRTDGRTYNVRGFWLEWDAPLEEPVDELRRALFGVEQLLRIGAPFIVPCDRHDLGSLTSAKPQLSVYVYETVPGGIGIAEKLLELWPEILRTGIRIAESCSCSNGCPSCLVPHRVPPGFREPRKDQSLELARRFLTSAQKGVLSTFVPDLHVWRPSH
jgi:DEAD/DEAH box helicase domain-containing protein